MKKGLLEVLKLLQNEKDSEAGLYIDGEYADDFNIDNMEAGQLFIVVSTEKWLGDDDKERHRVDLIKYYDHLIGN